MVGERAMTTSVIVRANGAHAPLESDIRSAYSACQPRLSEQLPPPVADPDRHRGSVPAVPTRRAAREPECSVPGRRGKVPRVSIFDDAGIPILAQGQIGRAACRE